MSKTDKLSAQIGILEGMLGKLNRKRAKAEKTPAPEASPATPGETPPAKAPQSETPVKRPRRSTLEVAKETRELLSIVREMPPELGKAFFIQHAQDNGLDLSWDHAQSQAGPATSGEVSSSTSSAPPPSASSATTAPPESSAPQPSDSTMLLSLSLSDLKNRE